MVIVLGRRLYRLILVVIILVLILPVIQYYALRTIDPQTVHFREPRGAALKVSAENQEVGRYPSALTRFLYYLHEFYQNGL